MPAPVEERSPRAVSPGVASAAAPSTTTGLDGPPQTYTVKRGDTLYAIALDLGLDYRELAAWNNIENINLIRVDQVLRGAPTAQHDLADHERMGTQFVYQAVAGSRMSVESHSSGSS